MTNIEALYNTCNTIINTFYPAEGPMILALANANMASDDDYVANDINIIKAALVLCGGFVATLQIEGDVHNDTDREAAKRNIYWWALKHGLDPDEYIRPDTVITDRSYLW